MVGTDGRSASLYTTFGVMCAGNNKRMCVGSARDDPDCRREGEE